MKRAKLIGIAAAIIVVIVAILLYNKSKSEAKSRTDILTSFPVSVATVANEKLSGVHSFVGTIMANNDVAVVSEAQGRITAVRAEVGEYRSAGSTIVEVDNELKQAAFATAEVNYEKAKKDLERFEALAKQNSATDQQLETARLGFKSAEAQYVLARRQLRDTKVTTPISGVVTARNVDVGTYVQSNSVVANVVDISTLKLKLNVAEGDVFRLRAGKTVEISTDVYPGVKFTGTIRWISSKGDEAHTYPVEIRMSNNKEHPLRAGMFARAAFNVFSDNDAVTVPRTALIGGIIQPQVYVVENDTARLRAIVAGLDVGNMVEVLQGLHPGEVVVVNGQNNLRDGIPITIIK
jgi:RND family efflux transporter MFP subunit